MIYKTFLRLFAKRTYVQYLQDQADDIISEARPLVLKIGRLYQENMRDQERLDRIFNQCQETERYQHCQYREMHRYDRLIRKRWAQIYQTYQQLTELRHTYTKITKEINHVTDRQNSEPASTG